MREYDLIADWYASHRTGDLGVPEVTALAASLPTGASVLDIGCGTGLPLTRVLLELGCQVTGVDSSRELVARFQANFPHVPVLCAPIQSCVLQERSFDAAVAWGVLFHLSHEEQEQAIAQVARALKSGAAFLFTSGDTHGSIDGAPMNGVPFRYHSYSIDGYRDLLRAYGLTLDATHADSGANRYFLSRKTR
ncbi:class I SAM-dependent methyltransferase [Myxococcaceae bacterium JPH2]|nr:class I SAM-dependent methyltransferase [Myxococcaceae bacterium JPH2]